MKSIIVPFFIAHQGCPQQCVFCNQEKISGSVAAIPTPAEMLGKLAAYRQSAPGRSVEVAFFGGTFTSLPEAIQERLLAPLQAFLANGEIVSVRVSTRPDAVDARTGHFLMDRGVRTVELGIQSMDDAVLVAAQRGHSASDTENAVRLLAAAGLRVGGQLMPGLPGDTPAKALATMRRTLALGPHFLRIYPALVIAGTQLERMYRCGEYLPLTLAGAVTLCKMMLLGALRVSVPVVRIGLQPTAALQAAGVVLAGPFHPAFRQLVAAELFFDLIVSLAGGLPAHTAVTLASAPERIADLVGQRRTNLDRLCREHGIKVAAVRSDSSLSRLELRVASTCGSAVRVGTVLDLDYSSKENLYVS